MEYKVICERTTDNKRYSCKLEAETEQEAIDLANMCLAAEPNDFYVISVEAIK